MKKYRSVLIASVVGIGLIVLWLRIVDPSELVSYLRKLDPILLVAASALYVFAYFLRSLRWRCIVSPVVNLSIPKAFGLSMIGYAINYLIPIRAGDVAQCVVLRRTDKVPIATSLPTVFIDRLMNLSPILLVLILIPLTSFELSTALVILLVVLLLVFGALVALLILSVKYKQRTVSLLERSLFMVPKRLKDRAVDFIDRFVDGMGVLRDRPRNLIPVIMLTIIIVFFDGAFFYMLFRAFGDHSPFVEILFGYTLLNLTYIMPMPPAQIGTNEMFMWLIFSRGLGMDTDLAASVIACAHILTGLLLGVLGVISIRFLRVSMQEAFSGDEEDNAVQR